MALRGIPSYLAVAGSRGEGDAPFRLDVLHAGSAIRSRAGKDDGNCPALTHLGKRVHEEIDRQLLTRRSAARRQLKGTTRQGHEGIGRNDIDVIGADGSAGFHLFDRHGRGLRDDFCQHAFVARIQMLDQHERYPRFGRQRMEEFLIRFEAARRGSDRDYGKRTLLHWGMFPLGRFLRGGSRFGWRGFHLRLCT